MMTIWVFAILASLPLIALSNNPDINDVNYSSCARFFNNLDSDSKNKRGYRIMDYGSMTKDRLRYIPFRIRSDGAINPHPGVDYSCDSNSNTCTYSYLSPPLEELEKITDKERMNSLKSDLKKVEVTVKKNGSGDIVEIFEGLPSNRHNQTPSENYRSIKGVRTTFETRNKTCVPMEVREVFTREKEEDGKKTTVETELPVLSTPLCRDLYTILEKNNNNLSACFDKAIGSEINDVFKKYFPPLLDPREGRVSFFNHQQRTDKINPRLNVKSSHHVPLQIEALAGYIAGANFDPEQMKRRGTSPVLSGQKILSHCYYRNTRDFIRDDSLWPKEPPRDSNPSGSKVMGQ